MKAPVSEIYASVQGEGPYTGQPQIFVRLAGCPLRCHYCDTPDSLVANGHPRMTVDEIRREIARLRESIDTVSITGGEPLIHAGFLKELTGTLKKDGFKIYLETAGIHAEGLKKVVKNCDVISMDIKLPSATGRPSWREHEKFLKVGRGKTFVKIVVEKHSNAEEISKAVEILEKEKQPPLLVLQPATPIPPLVEAPSPELLAGAYKEASARLPKVLVMPQQHKIWGVR